MADRSKFSNSADRRHGALARVLRIFLASWVVIGGSIAAVGATQTTASAGGTTNALYTTTDVHGATDTVTPAALTPAAAFLPCNNGGPAASTTDVVNCNTYPHKTTVWLSGGPTHATTSFKTTGTYFFAVIANTTNNPTPNDTLTNPGNLSYQTGAGDTWTNREFTVSTHGSVVTYTGTHGFDHTTKHIQIAPYATTPNPGGRYKLAVCLVPSPLTGAPGATSCKYDNYKVSTGKSVPTITTSVSGSSLTLGASGSVTDTATVHGNSTGGSPTGTVTFYLCKVSSTTGDRTTCLATTGNLITGTTIDPNPAPLTTGATDTSTGTSPPVAPTTAGSYCFSAVYRGSANYAAATDNTTTTTKAPITGAHVECFTVAPATTTTTTKATTLNGTLVLGKSGTISDSVKVTGVTGAPAPTGTVQFYECFTATTKTAFTCTASAPGHKTLGTPVSLTRHTSTTPPSATGTSAAVTATKAGWYCFSAVFAPSATTTNYSGSTDNITKLETNECVDIAPPPPSPPPSTPKFTVTKSDTPGTGKPVVPGATIGYSVLVTNVGTASGSATVTDPLPSDVTLTGTPVCATVATRDTCTVTVTGTTLVMQVTLAKGDSAKVTFDAIVKSTDTTTVVNTATITSGNCTAPHCSSTVTNPVIVLSVVKSSTPTPGSIVHPLTKVTYTLTLTNSGTAATGPVTITDKVPVGTTYVPGSAICGGAPGCTVSESAGTVTWTGIVVQPGAANALAVSFQAIVSATDTNGQKITNVAVFTNQGTPNCTTATCTTNRVTLVVFVTTSAPTHSTPPTPTPTPTRVSGATTSHTGEPWAGSGGLELVVLFSGLGLLAFGESLRRRRRRNPAGQ